MSKKETKWKHYLVLRDILKGKVQRKIFQRKIQSVTLINKMETMERNELNSKWKSCKEQ